MPTEFEPKAILHALNEHEVDYVVIGGVAGIAQGSVLPSFDLDIAYARDSTNLKKLAAVLREIGATSRGAPADLPFTPDARTLKSGSHFTFETPYGSFDILSDPSGAPKYPQLKSAAVTTQIDGENVLVASLDHLIAMKESTGREKDEYMARNTASSPTRSDYADAASNASPSRT